MVGSHHMTACTYRLTRHRRQAASSVHDDGFGNVTVSICTDHNHECGTRNPMLHNTQIDRYRYDRFGTIISHHVMMIGSGTHVCLHEDICCALRDHDHLDRRPCVRHARGLKCNMPDSTQLKKSAYRSKKRRVADCNDQE